MESRKDDFQKYLQLKFDPKKELDGIIHQTRNWFNENGGPDTKAVIGISGGKDSTIAAAILVRALGEGRVIGVIMPDGQMSDLVDALDVARLLNIAYTVVDISEITKALTVASQNACDGLNRDTAYQGFGHPKCAPVEMTGVNIPPRCRMALLRAIASALPGGGRLINTCNASEDYIGYSTKDGDCAGDFSVLKDYTVTELLLMADKGLPELPYEFVHKTPSDGLCGKTDEDALTFTYEDLDRYLYGFACINPEAPAKIRARHKANLHKLSSMPYCHRSKPLDMTD